MIEDGREDDHGSWSLSIQRCIGSTNFRRVEIHPKVLSDLSSTLNRDLKKRWDDVLQIEALYGSMADGAGLIHEELTKLGPAPTMKARVKYWLNSKVRQIFGHVRSHHARSNPTAFNLDEEEDPCLRGL